MTIRTRGGRFAGLLAAVALVVASFAVAAPAFADTGGGGVPCGGNGKPGGYYNCLTDPAPPIDLIPCPTSLLPQGVLAAFCIEITLNGGEANFGSVHSTISGPIKIRVVEGLTYGSGGLGITPIDDSSGGGGGGLAFPPIEVPGGLVGNAALNNLLKPVTGVTATIEPLGPLAINDVDTTGFLQWLAGETTGPLTLATASIPLRVQVNNALLGNTCYIGSASDPISLNLPLVLQPSLVWSGSNDTGAFNYVVSPISATDGSFSIPAASDCGLLGTGKVLDHMNLQQLNLFDTLLDQAVGLPSPSGNNLLSFQGYFGLTATGLDGITPPS